MPAFNNDGGSPALQQFALWGGWFSVQLFFFFFFEVVDGQTLIRGVLVLF